MKRQLLKRLKAMGVRLRDAHRVLTRQHYFLFSTERDVPADAPDGYYDMNWQEMRRQDVFQIGTFCLGLLAEDDECQSLVDEANDLLA